MKIIDLHCSGCGKPLSICFYEDGSNRKTIGCMQCLINPIITHTDWNKILLKKNLSLICNTECNTEKDKGLNLQAILRTKLTRRELKILSNAVLDDSIDDILNKAFVPKS